MRMYRVKYQAEVGVSAGFEFFLSKRSAERAIAAYFRDRDSLEEPEASIEILDFKPTRGGILDLLRKVASHPDNG